MNSEYIIRKPKMSDLDSLTDFINELSREKTFILIQGSQVTKKEEEKYLKDILKSMKDKKSCHLVLVNKENKIIGKAEISLKDKVESHIGGLGIALLKEARGKGLGEKLMREVIDQSKKNISNLKIITLSVFENNKIGLSLYNKIGFKKYGNLPDGIKHKNKFVDHIYMFKKIR